MNIQPPEILEAPAADAAPKTSDEIDAAIARIAGMVHGPHPWRQKDPRKGHTTIGSSTGWVFPDYNQATHPPMCILPRPPRFLLNHTALREAIKHGVKTPEQGKTFIDQLASNVGITPDDDEYSFVLKIMKSSTFAQAHALLVMGGYKMGSFQSGPPPQPEAPKEP